MTYTMTWRALWTSIALAFVWTATALYALRPVAPVVVAIPVLHHFVASMGDTEYRVLAHEARVEGFCTVFMVGAERIAAVCGQHTWSKEVEEQ